MKTYTLRIKLLSDALINSGEGFGAIIDSDVVFDDVGLPYIPAKRIKGCLRDAARESCEMLKNAQVISFFNLNKTKDGEYQIIEDVFGGPGRESPAPVYFSHLTIDDYEKNRQWLEYLRDTYTKKHTDNHSKEYRTGILTRDSVLATFTTIRQQTAISNEGVADEHSLRTIRVLKKGIVFYGEIHSLKNDPDTAKLLALGCLNLRRLGTKRNRGFGEVECKLFDGTAEVSISDELEALCTE
ncbi:MAG: RAMP superfamily CRISPR-associated protein [Candidatus Brocadia sp.]